MEVPGLGNESEPASTYATAVAVPDPLTHCDRPGIEPTLPHWPKLLQLDSFFFNEKFLMIFIVSIAVGLHTAGFLTHCTIARTASKVLCLVLIFFSLLRVLSKSSWFTMLWSFLLCSKVTQLYVYTHALSFRLFCLIGRVLCAIRQVPIGQSFRIPPCAYQCVSLFLFLFLAMLMACRSSWARAWIWATAATWATAVTMLEL